MEIKRVNPMSLAKMLAVIYFVIGLLILLFMMLKGGFAGVESLAIPVMNGIFGFIGGFIAAFVYNFVAEYIGGIEIETK